MELRQPLNTQIWLCCNVSCHIKISKLFNALFQGLRGLYFLFYKNLVSLTEKLGGPIEVVFIWMCVQKPRTECISCILSCTVYICACVCVFGGGSANAWLVFPFSKPWDTKPHTARSQTPHSIHIFILSGLWKALALALTPPTSTILFTASHWTEFL